MVIAVADVERWVQPDLIEKKTVGEAFLALSGRSDSAVAVAGPATVAVSARFPAGAAVNGVALARPFTVFRTAVAVQGVATVAVSCPVTTNDYHFAAATAPVRFTGPGAVQVAVLGSVLFGVYDRSSLAVVVTGDAEISFGDFGMDVPILPWTFPFQFTDTDLLPWGTAEVHIGGVGVVDAVAVTGDAKVRLTSSSRLRFQGSIPVFPFGFPAVFDSEATVRLGSAVVDLGRQKADLVVEVSGDATVPIYGASYALHQTIFAFQFPAIFDSRGYGRALAEFTLVADADVVVPVEGSAVVGITSSASVFSSAVFPWTFGIIFM